MQLTKPLIGAVLATIFWAAGTLSAQEVPSVRGKIDAVTVYRGQALVTRLVDVPAPVGLKEIVIGDLPDQVVPGSIYAEATAGDGVEVRSVSYRERPVETDVREAVRKLDEQIRAVEDKIAGNKAKAAVLTEQRGYLSKLEQFTAPTATVEMTKGVLNPDTVQKITVFQFGERTRLADEDLRLTLDARSLTEQQETLKRQREQVAGSSARTAREAVVFVNLTKAGGPGSLQLRYVVNSATWAPSYNVRTDKEHKQITVEYLASIQQMSGEDWPTVAMTLSTATPSLVAKAPTLGELHIALARGAGQTDDLERAFGNKDYGQVKESLKAQRAAVEQSRSSNGWNPNNNGGGNNNNNAGLFGGNGQATTVAPQQDVDLNAAIQAANAEADEQLNDAAGQLQLLDIFAKDKIVRKPGSRRGGEDEGYSVTYTLPGRTSLPSRSDRQLIQIAATPFKAEYSKVAAPVLTNFVYEDALLSNDGQSVLLAGPVSTYVDGQFVGQGFIPSVAVGEKFTVGLGIDSSLRTTRELVERTEATQGGNRVIDFTYDLRLENFSGKPANVRLMDRLPTARESELRVTMTPTGKDGQELSKDPAYEQTERKKGLLRWDVTVPAQAIGVKALALEYQFRMEYDRQMIITGPPAKK